MSAPSFTPQLRPLSVGEMLDAGFRLFRHRFGTLVACVVVPVVPLTILGTIVTASTDPNAYDVNAPVTDTSTAWVGLPRQPGPPERGRRARRRRLLQGDQRGLSR